MAMDEEVDIMREIGLSQHYNWWNGSGSCAWARKEAVRKLPDALRAHSLEPDHVLISHVALVAQHGEDSDYVLTRTWQCLSDVIQAHLHARTSSPENVDRLRESIRSHYPIREPMFDSIGRSRGVKLHGW